MAEPAPEPRLGGNAKAELSEIKRVIIAILQSIKDHEEETGEPFMRSGEYYGVKFE